MKIISEIPGVQIRLIDRFQMQPLFQIITIGAFPIGFKLRDGSGKVTIFHEQAGGQRLSKGRGMVGIGKCAQPVLQLSLVGWMAVHPVAQSRPYGCF